MSAGGEKGGRPLTGRGVLMIAIGAFAVILGANLTMMYHAVSGFPGLVTKNPYVAAQSFDRDVKAERALGWRFASDWADGRMRVHVEGPDGAPVAGLDVRATVGRPATMAQDRVIALSPVAGAHEGLAPLAPGLWRVEIEAVRQSDGARYAILDQIRVPGPPAPSRSRP